MDTDARWVIYGVEIASNNPTIDLKYINRKNPINNRFQGWKKTKSKLTNPNVVSRQKFKKVKEFVSQLHIAERVVNQRPIGHTTYHQLK